MTTASIRPYRTRLSFTFAADAPIAVILRRGPKTHWRLINWDLNTDTFTSGQWMKGIVRLCSLSPNGKKLIYFAAKYHRYSKRPADRPAAKTYEPLAAAPRGKLRHGRKVPSYLMRNGIGHAVAIGETWTAVSTPPYFTALAMWWADGQWSGGGFFHSNREIYVGERETRLKPATTAPLPHGFKVYSFLGLSPEDFTRLVPRGPPQPSNMAIDAIRKAILASGAEWVDLVYARSESELLLSWDGCAYRLLDWRDFPPEDYLARASLLADFRDMRFEPVVAPGNALHW